MTTKTEIQRRTVLRESARARYERMVEIRALEDKILELFAEGHVPGSTHTSQGQEAVAVALAAATGVDDWFTCTYRGHGHALALGMQPASILGEVLGRVSGSIGGVGGSMHLSDPTIGLLPTFAIVGAGLPVAVGAAIGGRYRGTGAIGVATCGDGATNIGAFHEALNLASVWSVPILFVIENNLYGEYSPLATTTPITDLYLRGSAYAMESSKVDGQDIEKLLTVIREMVDWVRREARPYLLEVKTYRYAGHSRSDPALYRPDGELEEWLARDPLAIARERLIGNGEATLDELDETTSRIAASIDLATSEALEAPFPDTSAMFRHVWAQNDGAAY